MFSYLYPSQTSGQMRFIKHFSEISESDRASVGGKALNLGRLTQAGFRVPDGFCVTTSAYRAAVAPLTERTARQIQTITVPPEIAAEVHEAHKRLRTSGVAVRSSATAEDLSAASFAGQQETFLNVTAAQLLDALIGGWASLWSERAIAYRAEQGIAGAELAMAVVVQEMCAAQVSGVLFTAAPFDETTALIESNWGLGESVVSGSVTPDSFHLSRETGAVLVRNISTKEEMVTATGVTPVPASQQDAPSLTDAELKVLLELGLRVEADYGQPMDIEWSLEADRFALLQARYITHPTQQTPHTIHPAHTESHAAIEEVRQSAVRALAARADAAGTIWSHHNLAEVLPAPLPMTWGLMQHFMSGQGGLGNAYRDLGFYPSEQVDRDGILDLICGRVYVNLNREAALYFDGFPLVHDYNALKADPQRAMYAQPETDITKSGAAFWWHLPRHILRMSRAERRLHQRRADFDRHLTETVFPEFQRAVEKEQTLEYGRLSDTELVTKFGNWRRETLDTFAAKALTATLLAGFSMQRLEAALQKQMVDTAAKTVATGLMSRLSGTGTVEMNTQLGAVANGDLTLDAFLKVYGHRAVDEFELATPRWREDASYLEHLIASFKQNTGEHRTDTDETAHRTQRESAEAELDARIGKGTGLRKRIESELAFTRRYMPFRETAKFYLMLGYEQIRRALLELDRRYHLKGGIFYLTPPELTPLITGKDFTETIAGRKRRRDLALQIEMPDVIFSDALEAIGAAPTVYASDTYTGTGISGGVATGPARVLLRPADVCPSDRDYILVCPSTDPAWTPLFLRAAGLVMERGGVLSHGAVVAREYGVPAVANIRAATARITDGQRLRVDGTQGVVTLL